MPSYNPFNSGEALRNSNYSVLQNSGDQPLNTATSNNPLAAQTQEVARHLEEFIIEKQHPCIIARSTIRGNSCRFGVYQDLGSTAATAGLSHDLIRFLEERPLIEHPYASYMAVFITPPHMSEKEFESRLWKQLELLEAASSPHFAWDKSTSSNPEDDNFGFSFGGKSFYVVGMHANSSRKARQFPYPMLVFNLHDQFESMRQDGSYDKVKKIIRRNDKRLQGHINPMLQDFGENSEARQYSGRAVPDSWKCPFHHA